MLCFPLCFHFITSLLQPSCSQWLSCAQIARKHPTFGIFGFGKKFTSFSSMVGAIQVTLAFPTSFTIKPKLTLCTRYFVKRTTKSTHNRTGVSKSFFCSNTHLFQSKISTKL